MTLAKLRAAHRLNGGGPRVVSSEQDSPKFNDITRQPQAFALRTITDRSGRFVCLQRMGAARG
jgi:hypothetical protein